MGKGKSILKNLGMIKNYKNPNELKINLCSFEIQKRNPFRMFIFSNKSKALFFVCILLLILNACTHPHKYTFTVEKGNINLQNWDFESNPEVTLDGDWEFYWNELLNPKDFLEMEQKPQFKNVPLSWTNYVNENGKRNSAYGFATYRLTIQLPDNQKDLSLFIPKIWSSTKVFANGKRIHEAGKVSESTAYNQDKSVEILLPVMPERGKIDLVVQVSNHELFIGGIVQNFSIGKTDYMQANFILSRSSSLIWLGVLLVMTFYHLLLYFFRRKQKSELYFGLVCAVVTLRFIVFGEHYLYLYLKNHTDWFTFAVQSKTYYITTLLLIPLGLVHTWSLYPKYIQPRFVRLAFGITLVYVLLILCLPFRFFSDYILLYQFFLVVFALYFLSALVRAFLAKEEDSTLQFSGIIVMLLAGINDGLHTLGIEIFGQLEILPQAFGVFLFLQFIILARRFTKAFNEVEDLTVNLEARVTLRTQEIAQQKEEIEQINTTLNERQGKLEYAYAQIKDSVVYASRIQNAILPHANEINESFKDAFIFYSPRDIVSGDFYWLSTIDKNELLLESMQFGENDKLSIVVAADCTGHGVPGAFMTVMANDFLNEIILHDKITHPTQILTELDRKIMENLGRKAQEHQPTDGLDIALVIWDKSNNTLQFAGAKNSLYFVRDGEIQEIKASRFSIGSNSFSLTKTFDTHTFQVQTGDIFYLYTDGFQDQFDANSAKKYMKRNFRNFLLNHSQLSMPLQKDALQKELTDWKGVMPQTDDILVVGIRIC